MAMKASPTNNCTTGYQSADEKLASTRRRTPKPAHALEIRARLPDLDILFVEQEHLHILVFRREQIAIRRACAPAFRCECLLDRGQRVKLQNRNEIRIRRTCQAHYRTFAGLVLPEARQLFGHRHVNTE